jgi:cytochrome c peroxidase
MGIADPASAQAGDNEPDNYAWQSKAIAHMQRMRGYRDADYSRQLTPPIIPSFVQDPDPSGIIATRRPGKATVTSENGFFSDLGTNNRTCFTCHQPKNGWGVSAQSIQERFGASQGADPIFRLVDGANCPSANVTNAAAKRNAYSLLLNRGTIRIGLPVPANAEYRIVSVSDPYDCNTNPVTGLTTIGLDNATTGIVSVYRRPLPATNLGFNNTIMWDGREPSLAQQAIDATLGHAQASTPPAPAQQAEIVAFESGLLTAQEFDNKAKALNAAGATGGADGLIQTLTAFFPGINDPLGGNPNQTPFTSKIFSLYDAWSDLSGSGDVNQSRAAIAHGQEIFNNTPINITDVAGLNDVLNAPTIQGFCGTCHDSPNVGNHSVRLPINIGIANGGPNNNNPVLNIADLPVFNITCVTGPNAGRTYVVTDPGRALISGKCADIGKIKGPILRGLASRAPYFHNGSAATLTDVANFYNQRFDMGMTAEDVKDLVAFLNTL